MEQPSAFSSVASRCIPEIPQEFYTFMAERKHIDFERADLQNNIVKFQYYYANHKALCEYHMAVTEGIYDWSNYRAFLARQ